MEPLENIKSKEQAEAAVKNLDEQIDKISDLNIEQKEEVSRYLVELMDKLMDMHPIPKEIVGMVEDLREDLRNIDPNWKFEVNEGNVHAELGWVWRPNPQKEKKVGNPDTSLMGGSYKYEVKQTTFREGEEFTSEDFINVPTGPGALAEAVLGESNYKRISLDSAVSVAKNYTDIDKLKFLAGFGLYFSRGYDVKVMKGEKDRKYMSTEKLIDRIATGQDSGAVCAHIHLALSDIANRMGLESYAITVGASMPHMISGIVMSNGTIALIDYDSIYMTNEKSMDRAVTFYEKVSTHISLNRVNNKNGVTTQIVKSPTYEKKEEIMRGGGDEVDKSEEWGHERWFLKDGTEIVLTNEKQKIEVKKDGWQILMSHEQFDNVPEISVSHLTGVGFWKEFYTKHNLFRVGTSVDNEVFKPATYGRNVYLERENQTNQGEHNTDISLSLDHTVRAPIIDSEKYELAFANTVSGLASACVYNSILEEGSLKNKSKDGLNIFEDGRLTDVASLGYFYVDPASPNKFYAILGVNAEAQGDTQNGILMANLNGMILKTGTQIQVMPGTVISGELSAKQYGGYVDTEGSAGIENYKAGKLGVKAAKKLDFSDKNLVDQRLDLEVGYNSPTIAKAMNVYIGGGEQYGSPVYRLSLDLSPVINRAIDRKKK